MKVIALAGPHDTGKTTTFGNLYDILIADGDYELIKDKYIAGGRKPRGKDFLCVFKNINNNLKIGLSSYGDHVEIIESSLSKLKNNELCDVAVTACLSYGNTHDSVKKYDEQTCFISKTKPYCNSASNISDAKNIQSKIDKF